MKIFITGASGYIGGSVAKELIACGHRVTGLTRDTDKASVLAASGIEPVIGTLEDHDILIRESKNADAVVSAADADHRASVEAMVGALAGSGKILIHTSGSSLVGDDVRGDRASESIYDEDTPLIIEDHKKARHEINALVLESRARGVRSAVICPSLVYGVGTGINRKSIQVPFLVDQARRNGVVHVVGRGLNRWSTVHIEDLVDLYRLAVDSAPAGSFYFAENGESSFADIGAAIAARLGLGTVQSWDADEAANHWGPGRAYYTYGSNSRVRAKRAKQELGWKPTHGSVLDWIRDEMPNKNEDD